MLRVSPEEEISGLDLSEYGVKCYPVYPLVEESGVNGVRSPVAPAQEMTA